MLIVHREQCFPSHADEAMYAEADSARARSSDSISGGDSISEASAAAGVADAVWWYSNAGQQVGPVSGGELAALLAAGQVSLGTWVFEAGTADWQELSHAVERLPRLSTL